MIEDFLHCFIPLFVAVDAFGITPVFLSLTHTLSEDERSKLVIQSTLTALGISMLSLLAGRLIFQFMGITDNDFRVGGGIVLLVLAVQDLLSTADDPTRKPPVAGLAIVPIGIPLIMGPSALTTVLMVGEARGIPLTMAALLVNLFLVWLVFRNSKYVVKILGEGGTKAVGKITSLFLAAIAVMMIRVGITNFLS